MERTEIRKPKRIPYGISGFEKLRNQNCYYVDKTRYVELVEEANNFFFFIRPRRFGKSLLLTMLESYYDLAGKDKFDALFGDLYIGKHPTPNRNSYVVVELDFSSIGGDMGDYKTPLDEKCRETFRQVCVRYQDYLPKNALETVMQYSGAVAQLQCLCGVCDSVGLSMYLFIDEYDHFTNDILSSPERLADYENETHGEGYLRRFFNAIKEYSKTTIDKLFVTGVSPVTMDDLTSGFNIGTNYTADELFNGMVGFTETEVRELLDYYAAATGVFKHATDELIDIMKPYYDNYCFAKNCIGEEPMYNSNMVFYFLDNYIRRSGKLPEDMLDANIRTDYNKLRMLVRKDKEFSPDASTIQQIVNQGYIVSDVNSHFPARDIAKPSNFVSLLYYFGMLTYGGRDEDGETKLVIPNQVVQEQIYTVLLNLYNDINLTQDDMERRALERVMASKGEWKCYFDYIAERLHTFASTRDIQKGEAIVHGFVLAMLSLNTKYFPYSEPDTNGGYADILLSPRINFLEYVNHSYVIELKYVKPSQPAEAVETALAEAAKQVMHYADASHAVELSHGKQLHRLCVVFHGLKEMVCREVTE